MSEMNPHVLGDRYELVDRIGTGGTASVYLARDTLLGRNVAIKLLHWEHAEDPTFIKRFRREAQAAASLNHPNVVTVYDWGEAPSTHAGGDAVYFLVMEYVPGPNLSEVLRQRGRLSEADALDTATQVASALDAAHKQSLVHRDVKPHNVLLDPFGTAKVTDFGIAHAAGLSQLTATNTVSGTAHYLSPEQAQRLVLDGRSDIYSLGIMLYELLTGRVPFDGETLVEVALQHIQQTPEPPRHIRPDISPATEAIVLRALAKQPADRFPTAAAMRDELRDARERLATPVLTQESSDTTVIGGFPAAEMTQTIPGRGTVKLGSLSPGPRPRLRRTQSSRITPWMALPLVFLLLILGGSVLYVSGAFNSGHHASGPVAAAATATPGRTNPIVVHTTPSPTPTARPATATPRPAPSATQAPVATATVGAATSTAPAATATSPPPTAAVQSTAQVAAVSANSGNPADAVAQFYQDVERHRFSQAASLWAPAMRSQFDPYQNINLRFADTHGIVIKRLRVVSKSASEAEVSVKLVETRSDGSQVLKGSWTVVRGPGGNWLLAYPNFGD